MCHAAVPYVVMAIGAYVSAQSANQQAQDTNDMYVRNAQLRKQHYMNQIDRLREERMKVAKAGKVEAEKFSDAMLDQKKQLIEATGQAVVQTGEGTGERNAILNSINRHIHIAGSVKRDNFANNNIAYIVVKDAVSFD